MQVKSVLTTLSGDELVQLREELEQIKESFSLMEFDDEEDDSKGKAKAETAKTNDNMQSIWLVILPVPVFTFSTVYQKWK